MLRLAVLLALLGASLEQTDQGGDYVTGVRGATAGETGHMGSAHFGCAGERAGGRECVVGEDKKGTFYLRNDPLKIERVYQESSGVSKVFRTIQRVSVLDRKDRKAEKTEHQRHKTMQLANRCRSVQESEPKMILGSHVTAHA